MTGGLAAAVAVAASIGAGLVHVALGPEHLEELGALGWGFYLAAALQLGWPVAVLAARGAGHMRQLAVAGIAINLAILGAWVVSRTVGLPAGETPWVPEEIGRVDVITAVLEVAIIAAMLTQLRTRNPAPARGSRMATAISVLVIAVASGAALAPDASHADGDHDHATPAAEDGGMHTEGHEAMTGTDSAP